jgi:hypothetical protein
VDWTAWHELYDVAPGLIARLRSVRAHIGRCLDLSPPGPLGIVSICAGDGRDLIGALVGHPRARDVRARLIEQDPTLVERGRAAADAAGFADALEFVVADATAAPAYQGFAPAQVVVACGVLGNVRKADTPRFVESLRALCARGGFVVWTREVGGRLRRAYGRPGAGAQGADVQAIEALLRQWSFEETRAERTADGGFLVATWRHLEDPPVLGADGGPLFAFRSNRP